VVCLLAAMTGCHAVDFYTPALEAPIPPELEPPRELSKVSLPTYRIEPPDVIQLDVLRLVPRPLYRIDASDVLQIRVIGVLVQQPIDDFFLVDSDGVVALGPAYGVVRVAGMTTVEAAAAIRRALQAASFQNPAVTVQLARSASAQDISRDYRVAPDGVIHLSRFGAVHLAGKTVTEAKLAIQNHLAQYFDSPMVGVDVVEYNSKVYYVILGKTCLGGSRAQMFIEEQALYYGMENLDESKTKEFRLKEMLRIPFMIRGNETVLDALSDVSRIGELRGLSSKTMWIARPAPNGCGEEQILPIDWDAIAAGGQTKTNYQILPGDRLYVADDNLLELDNYISLVTNPISRLLNMSTLGTSTTKSAQTLGRSYNLNRNP